ncbi:hypothetical protein [Peptostreptococcus stomatis]|uniref:hypothetical protein n=1 Tax=Peptostreptococcus stomatis TaxID=341694 RepID=UPI003F9F5E37
MVIKDKNLKLLLETKREFIGKTVAIDSLLSAIAFCISVYFASYGNGFFFLGYRVSGVVIKTIFLCIGIFFTFKSIRDIYYNKKNTYTYEDLYNDITDISELANKHSIIALKDSFDEYPNRYLVYNDKRWNCMFFPNYKTNENNKEFIITKLSNNLKVDKSYINLEFVKEFTHDKFSHSSGKMKVYQHRLYYATLDEFPEHMKNDRFVCDSIQYRWMTISDMENDEMIKEKNIDVVNFVKGFIP